MELSNCDHCAQHFGDIGHKALMPYITGWLSDDWLLISMLISGLNSYPGIQLSFQSLHGYQVVDRGPFTPVLFRCVHGARAASPARGPRRATKRTYVPDLYSNECLWECTQRARAGNPQFTQPTVCERVGCVATNVSPACDVIYRSHDGCGSGRSSSATAVRPCYRRSESVGPASDFLAGTSAALSFP